MRFPCPNFTGPSKSSDIWNGELKYLILCFTPPPLGNTHELHKPNPFPLLLPLLLLAFPFSTLSFLTGILNANLLSKIVYYRIMPRVKMQYYQKPIVEKHKNEHVDAKDTSRSNGEDQGMVYQSQGYITTEITNMLHVKNM